MDVKFVSPAAFMADWLTTRLLDKNIIVKKAVNDYVSRLLTVDQLTVQISLISIENSIGKLPYNFKNVIQAAYGFPEVEKNCTKERVTQWAGENSECKYTISVKCPKCNRKNCKCSDPIATLDVNLYDLEANPQWTEHRRTDFYSFGKVGDGCYSSGYNPYFILMRPTTNHFFNINAHIKNCVNYQVTSEVEYKIFDGTIEVNVPKCKVLLAYLGYNMDSKGLLMVPDLPEVWSGLRNYVDYQIAYDKYTNTYDQKHERAFKVFRDMAEKEMVLAKIKLGRPSIQKLKHVWNDFYGKIVRNHYHDEALGGYLPENYPRI